jgi:hypothetical protein
VLKSSPIFGQIKNLLVFSPTFFPLVTVPLQASIAEGATGSVPMISVLAVLHHCSGSLSMYGIC